MKTLLRMRLLSFTLMALACAAIWDGLAIHPTRAAEPEKPKGDGHAEPKPFPGAVGRLEGFIKYDFKVDGVNACVVEPKKPLPGRPWVWRAEFFGISMNADLAMVEQGWHLAFIDAPDLFGSPKAIARWEKFHDILVHDHQLSPKPALIGLSRGALYAMNWAAAHPDKTLAVYLDNGVCDFKSWPGGKPKRLGTGTGNPGEWAKVLKAYDFKDDREAIAYKLNPVDRLTPLAEAKVPVLLVYGDSDTAVPHGENSALVYERYKALGGPVEQIVKKGQGHHPHGLTDPKPIAEFFERAWREREAKPAAKPPSEPERQAKGTPIAKADDKPKSDDQPAKKTIDLFNGKDLTGWKPKGTNSKWVVGKATLDEKDPAKLVVTPAEAGQQGDLINPTGSVDLYTEQKFGDGTLEVEFMIPKGSNSGVYVLGEYEIQILDSFGKAKVGPGDLGGVYNTAAPKVNASRKPGEWQKFVIEYQAPRFEGDKKVSNVKFIKITLNDQVIHEDVEAKGPTGGSLVGKEAATGPVMLQGDHGPVVVRTIRFTAKAAG